MNGPKNTAFRAPRTNIMTTKSAVTTSYLTDTLAVTVKPPECSVSGLRVEVGRSETAANHARAATVLHAITVANHMILDRQAMYDTRARADKR